MRDGAADAVSEMLPDEMIARIELMESFDPETLADELAHIDDEEVAAAFEDSDLRDEPGV